VHPAFPFVEGKYQMTDEWSVTLPDKFNQRMEDGSLVLWKSGFTVWASVWNNDRGESKEARLADVRKGISKDSFDVQVLREKNLLRLAYRLSEQASDRRVAAFYGFVFGAKGYVQLGIYFDDEKHLELAKKIWLSLEEHHAVRQHVRFHGIRASSRPMPQVSVTPAKISPAPTAADRAKQAG
jgi:hypothetical protein